MSKERRDVYYRLSKDEGWRARSAYKLLQLNNQFDLFSDVTRAVDLCAAPGSWTQVLSKHLPENSVIVSVDLAPMAPLPRVTQIQGDITKPETSDKILRVFLQETEKMGYKAADGMCDLVLCDGAPDVTGIHDLDEFVQAGLVNHAMTLAFRVLKVGGTFVSKVFRGHCTQTHLLATALHYFETAAISKPDASRASSMECFLVCQRYRGHYSMDPSEIDYNDFRACGDLRKLDSNRSYPLSAVFPAPPY